MHVFKSEYVNVKLSMFDMWKMKLYINHVYPYGDFISDSCWCPKIIFYLFSLLLEMAASYSKWGLIQTKMFKKMIELDQHVGFFIKELILKTLQCALRIFNIHLFVLHPESSLHMCSPEKDMKGQYSFGTFPLSFLHTSRISNVIQFEVMGTELMWALY